MKVGEEKRSEEVEREYVTVKWKRNKSRMQR
jgi:hypothetical protein